MSKEKTLSKLQKIMDKAKSAEEIGSMAEAQAFMAKANELMLRHNLNIAEVETFDEENGYDTIAQERIDTFELGIPSKNQRVAWQERVGGIIASFHNCKMLVSSGTNTLWFVGRKKDREVCSYVYAYAVRSAIKYSDSEYRRLYSKFYAIGQKDEMKGWIPAFFRGFTNELNSKFQEMHKSLKTEIGDEKYALITTDPSNAVAEWMRKNLRTGTANGLGGMSGSNAHGQKAGSSFAKSMSINKGVSQGAQKQIGGR